MLTSFCNEFTKALGGVPIDFSVKEIQVVLSEVGLTNIIEIEEKFLCKMIPNVITKKLSVLCLRKDLKNISNEIREKINNKFFYRIPLNTMAVKFFMYKPDKYKVLEEK